jgi:hypothetical protein
VLIEYARRLQRKLELEEDPERAWMSDMDDVMAQLNKHPDQVTIVQVNAHRLLGIAPSHM